jgi:hypothetical protein
MLSFRNARMIYNVWDDDATHVDAWTHNRAAAHRLARYATHKHRAVCHVTEYPELNGNVFTHTFRRLATYTPWGVITGDNG